MIYRVGVFHLYLYLCA